MKFTITLSETAEFDIFDIHDYVEFHDTLESAERLLDGIVQAVFSLTQMPHAAITHRNWIELAIGISGKFISSHTESFTPFAKMK